MTKLTFRYEANGQFPKFEVLTVCINTVITVELLGVALYIYLVVISVIARLEDHGSLRVVGRGRNRLSGGGEEAGRGLGWG